MSNLFKDLRYPERHLTLQEKGYNQTLYISREWWIYVVGHTNIKPEWCEEKRLVSLKYLNKLLKMILSNILPQIGTKETVL